MVTIFGAGGLRIVIFLDDHEPAHVHVFGDGHAKINLAGAGGRPELVACAGFKRNDIRRAMAIVSERRDEFLARRRDIHG
ncbi:MAG: DUF4160 domain-containing protein [Mesorhizobium sp.]